MIRASARFGPAMAILCLVFAVPGYVAPRAGGRDDCANPAALRDLSRIPGSRALRERRDLTNEQTFQWTEGRSQGFAPDPLNLWLLRTNAPEHFHVSPRGFLGALSFLRGRQEFKWQDAGDDEIPVHWVRNDYDRAAQPFAYFTLYDGRPVRSVLWASLAAAPRRILRGPATSTLYLVHGQAEVAREGALERAMQEWLAAAWSDYRRVCTP